MITQEEYEDALEVIKQYESQPKKEILPEICPECGREWIKKSGRWKCDDCVQKYYDNLKLKP